MDSDSNPSNSDVESGAYPNLDEVEQEVVTIFVSLADLLGFPRSLGEIYGLAFISQNPLHLGEVCGRLRMSKGSASQGLRTLRDLGALKPVYVAGDRRDYFEPELRIRVLLYRLLAERLRPHLDRTQSAVEALESRPEAELGATAAERMFRRERVALLSAWRRRVAAVIPFLQRFLK